MYDICCFVNFNTNVLGPRSHDTYGDDKIKNEVMYAGERRYYLDLKENSRGRFLKVTALYCSFYQVMLR